MTGAERPFRIWLVAATASTLGDSVTGFALGWAATAHGPGAASTVLAIESVPLFALILLGGVAADRWGIRRIMIVCDVAMTVTMAAFALTVGLSGSPLWLLGTAALLSGTAAAIRRPAAGAFPRLFVPGGDGRELARLTATVTMGMQTARIAGPALGGVLVAGGGLTATSALDAVTFAVLAAVLVRVRPPYEPPRPAGGGGGAGEALVVARRTPGVPAALLAVAGLAATVIPFVDLCVPLAGRERHWGPGVTGAVEAAWIVGGLAVTSLVSRRGPAGPRAAALGPVIAAAGAWTVGLSGSPWLSGAGVGAVGVGVTLLTSRLFPRFVAATPPHLLARMQSLLGIAQTGPILLATPALGLIASRIGLGAAIAVVGAVLVLTAVAAAASAQVGRDVVPAADPADEPDQAHDGDTGGNDARHPQPDDVRPTA